MARGWSYEETKALVSVWGEANVQKELDQVSRNRSIFEKIAKAMEKLGHEKSWQQCRTKIKNLTQKYRKVKDSNRVSGRHRTTCPFYEELDAILGTRAASSPALLIESSNTVAESTESTGDNSAPDGTMDSERDLTPMSEKTDEVLEEHEIEASGEQDGSAQTSTSAEKQGSVESPSNVNQCSKQGKKKRKRQQEAASDLSKMLTKFVEVAEEHDLKRMRMEAELEERRREQERKHEERMMAMMLSYMTSPGPSHVSTPSVNDYTFPFPPTPLGDSFYRFPPSQFTHSSDEEDN